MGNDILKCGFCGSHVIEGHNDWECDCGAVCSFETGFKWVKSKICPKCKNDRQVWENQETGKYICHRLGCHKEIKQ
jgi:hypothetical protein